jgi:hypothetical protein
MDLSELEYFLLFVVVIKHFRSALRLKALKD